MVKRTHAKRVCRACTYEFDALEFDGEKPRECCGSLHCRASLYWTDEEWEGRARMVDALLQAKDVNPAGTPQLNELDREALAHRSAR